MKVTQKNKSLIRNRLSIFASKISGMKLKHKRLALKICISIALLIIVAVVSLLKNNAYIAENVFSRGIGRAWVTFVGSITSLFPFSFYELAILALVAALIWGIVLIVKVASAKSKVKLASYVVTIWLVASAVLAVYSVSASPNYYRNPVPLQYASAQLDADIIRQASEYFVEDFNKISARLERNERGDVINPYTNRELGKIMAGEMKRLDNPYYSSFTPTYKPIIFSDVLDVMGIGGVFFAPTGEANISTVVQEYYKPQIIAHELAHSKGVMREDEANLIAYYITLTSDNDFVRYSGYMSLFFGSILNSVKVSTSIEAARMLYDSVDKNIKEEYYRAPEKSSLDKVLGNMSREINKLATKFNDFYLKLSGTKDGVDSYNPGQAIILPPQIIEDQEIPQYQLTSVQRLIFQIYLDSQN